MKKGICGLYCFKNKEGQIIYIGKADDINERLKHHKHLSEECYKEVNSIEYTIITNRADRDILETLLISQINPKYNTQQKYEERASLIIDSSVMLLWQKIDPKEYHFENKKQVHIGTGKPGRPRVSIPDEFYILYPKWKAGEITAVNFMRQINMPKATFYKKVKEYEQQIINNP